MWSSKEVLFISIATGFVFCFATIYAQNAMRKYVNLQIQEKTGNPLIGTTLASRIPQQTDTQTDPDPPHAPRFRSAPPGCGTRWTPLPT